MTDVWGCWGWICHSQCSGRDVMSVMFAARKSWAPGGEDPAAGISHGGMANSFTYSCYSLYVELLRGERRVAVCLARRRQRGSPLRPGGIGIIFRNLGLIPRELLSENLCSLASGALLSATRHARSCGRTSQEIYPKYPRTEQGRGSPEWGKCILASGSGPSSAELDLVPALW